MTEPFMGEIRMFGFERIPVGWVTCDGRLLSINENPALYALLGVTYGGDGVNQFGVPDLRGRVPLHQGTGPGLTTRTLGQQAGAETVTLTPPQMPAHTHTLVLTSAAASVDAPSTAALPGAVVGDTYYVNKVDGATPAGMNAAAVSSSGGNLPHENCMPTLTVQYCIAVNGLYPSQQ